MPYVEGSGEGGAALPPDAVKAAERMYEDETLAGDGAITDVGLGALLAAVERVARTRAHRAAGTDALAGSMRRLARACIRASESSDVGKLAPAATNGIISREEAALAPSLVPMGPDADENARSLSAYLVALVSGSVEPTGEAESCPPAESGR